MAERPVSIQQRGFSAEQVDQADLAFLELDRDDSAPHGIAYVCELLFGVLLHWSGLQGGEQVD
jgi:hypothetical protein